MNANDFIQDIFDSNTHADASYFADDASLNTDNADTGVDLYITTMSLRRSLLKRMNSKTPTG